MSGVDRGNWAGTEIAGAARLNDAGRQARIVDMGGIVRVGIIGCGNITLRRHLPAFAAVAGVEVRALADPTPDRLQIARVAAGLTEADCALDWREVIARPDIDAVVVATPQRVRPTIAIAAAEAGKHLLCEKPLALSPAEAHAMVEVADSHRVTLATVHNYIFMPVYRAIKEVLDSGEIGEVEVVTLNFLSVEDRPGAAAYAPRWRHAAVEAGGGVLMDMLHAVYLAGWFLGADPIAVSAVVDRRLDGEGDVEDFALVRYDYPRGHALINMAWGHGPGGVELAGTRGRLMLINEGFGTHPFVPPERIHVVGPAGHRAFAPDPEVAPSFELIVADFRDAVAQGRPPAAGGVAGAAVLEAVIGAYASAALRQEVTLPLDPANPIYTRGAAGIPELALPEGCLVRRRGLFGVGRAH